MKKLLIILILITNIASAQKNNADSNNFISKHRYLKYLFMADNSSQARMFTAGIHYLHTTHYQTVKLGGMHVSLGIIPLMKFLNY